MPKGINYILPLLLSVVSLQLNAQNFNLSNHRTFANLLNKHVDTLENFHTSIRPFSKKELPEYDAIINSYPTKKASFIQNEHFVTNQKKTFLLDPVVNLGATLEQKENTAKGLLERAIGFNIHYYLGEKWSSQILFLSDHSSYPSHINSVVETKNNSPGYGYSTANHSYYSQANITFTPSNVFAFQLGYGKNFIGDGYRSLLLSDNANSYPYLKVTATVWKLKYMALYTNYQDIGSANGRMSNYFHKFSATHYLSLNATKWWNIGLFESIIWQAQEGDFYRGYDIHYINPLMILRPTEYAQGSADNALIGSSMKFKIKKKNILYTQLVLDEFLLREMTARNGWWANKYGYQIGLKSYDVVGIKNATLQLEYNTVRPFTYSHSYTPTSVSTLQNYAHFNAPLAHPLGANFKEAMTSLSYQKKRWIVEAMATIVQVGFDTNTTTSVGQNVYTPNNWRAADYGNATTQGLTTNIVNTTLKVSYLLNPQAHLLIEAGISNRNYKNSLENTSSNLFFVGIKTAITNRYFDF